MEFNTSWNIVAADVRTCLRPNADSNSLSSHTLQYDHGHVTLSFISDSSSTPITKDCRVQLKELVDAFNFNNILDLKRWTNIKDLSDRSQINWDATWGLFNYHVSAKRITTSFKHSNRITFITKLLMDELPLQDKLVRRRPDLYKSHWKCALCNTEQESWSHLWHCPNLQNRINALLTTTKEAYLSLLRTYVPRLSTTFVDTFTSLPCWSLPSHQEHIQDLNFDSLVRGFIPSALTDLLSTVANKKEVAVINNSIFSTAQAIF